MKTKSILLVVAAMAALSAQAADERVNIDQLPMPVRKTLDVSRGSDPVKEIIRTTADGRTIYHIEIERNNRPNPRLRIADDGTLVREPAMPYVSTSDMPVLVTEYPTAPTLPRLQLSDLPSAVQQSARSEANGREIADIDIDTWKGRRVYEVEFKDPGLNSRVYFAEDGTLVRDERSRSLKSLFMGMQLEDTPAAVQDTIRRIAGDRKIADIDKKGTNAEPVYRVEIRGPQGTQELRIAQDGKVLHDSRATTPPRG